MKVHIRMSAEQYDQLVRAIEDTKRKQQQRFFLAQLAQKQQQQQQQQFQLAQ